MEDSLFSIVILHYNQPRYVLRALDSVLNQNYSNIELVFADDASTAIDLPQIKKYIDENKNSNIKNVQYSINEENVGTVKTINRAVKKCQGKHILFFAADDALCNEDVITNFVNAFKAASENVYMISAQCYMMDINLEEKLDIFVKPTYAASFNRLTAVEQYKVFCRSCFLAIGATAMRREMFEKFGYFNEDYKFVEDWSYFLQLTRNGGLVRYNDFEALLHRDGGVSHFIEDTELPPHVMTYRYDLLKILENEVIPFLKQFEPRLIISVLNRYAEDKKDYKMAGGTQKVMPIAKLVKLFPSFYIQSAVFPIIKNWDATLKMVKLSAEIALVFMACVVAAVLMPTVIAKIFSVFSYLFALLLVVAIVCCFGIVCIKIGLVLLRYLKNKIKGKRK